MAHSSRRPVLALIALACLAAAGCARDEVVSASGTDQPPATSAPPPAPRSSLEPDTTNAPIERAAPPTLQPVALGRFDAADRVSRAMTGALRIEDSRITGDNGAGFLTERVAIVRGGDEFTAGQRYADVMMVDAGRPVELRRVLDETRADDGQAFCGSMKTGFLALASYEEAGIRVVKLVALQGDGIPAATAEDTQLCAATSYEAAP
ncbi:hypothetical protein [Luteimonas terricola]|uniref:Uncharacterized protein n=1 Tax=Luteimonas terricola TaxID=645597 RepID=A0ABQ2EAQ7_9GAMM|nr:hypothetical protein [Luteimonas terricola]GGK04156.1 hypothetical protein GCM10011394_11410 [Luteimonas terricola]